MGRSVTGRAAIRMVSLMAENADFLYRGMAGYLTRRTGIRMEIVESVPWQERERMLDRGEVQMGFICGLPYVRKVDRPHPVIELLAAPVMQDRRYQGRPVYFSDVVVHRESPFRSFSDLRGASWAYNEPGSQSGYNLVRWHLAWLGQPSGFFGRVVEAGAHQIALRMVVEGRIDASAIDSTVLAMELKRRPDLVLQLRVIEPLGPSTILPAVIQTSVPEPVRYGLRQALLEMHQDEEGRSLLSAAMMARFVAIANEAYDGIRRMAVEAERVELAPPRAPLTGG